MAANVQTFWTDERTELLLKLEAEGVSRSEVAKRIGTTRSAVIGKLFRLNGAKQSRPRSRKKKGSIVKPSANASKLHLTIPAAKELRRLAEEMKAAIPPEPRYVDGVRLQDLPDDGCRWPVNEPAPGEEHLFCGDQKKLGRSYCEKHCRVAYEGRIRPVPYVKVAA